MKSIFFVLVAFLFIIGMAEATSISLGATWQLSSNSTRPGGYSTLYLTITNTGTDITGVTITPTAGPNLKIISGSSADLGDMPAVSSQQATITVKADEKAPSTVSYVFVEITYYYSSSQYKKQIYVPINIRRDAILQIENVNFNNSLQPGNNVLLSFDLTNQGLGDAKDITVSILQSDDFIVSDSSGEFFIDSLANSESKKMIFPLTVSPDALVGTTTVPVKISYYDETRTNIYTETKSIGTSITGTYGFVVTTDSQDVIAPDTSGFITIKMANSGSEEALHLTMKVVQTNSIEITPKTVYIGNLKSDDYDSEKLSMDVGSVSAGSYPVALQLSYEDIFGKSYSEIYTINARVSSKEEYQLTHEVATPTGVIIIVFVVIAIILFFAYRKGYLRFPKKK
jgi:hypothetical protein